MLDLDYLRGHGFDDAADEIERLREELRLQTDCTRAAGERADRLRDKIERLRGLLDMHERRMNRAVGVENTLLEMAAGKRQPPTPEECRALAITLGVPDEFRKAALAQEGEKDG